MNNIGLKVGAGILALLETACSAIGPHRGPDGRTYWINCMDRSSPCYDWFIKAPDPKDWTNGVGKKSMAKAETSTVDKRG